MYEINVNEITITIDANLQNHKEVKLILFQLKQISI